MTPMPVAKSRILRLPIATPRLIVREFTASDADTLCSWICDPGVMRHLFQTLENEEEARIYLGRALGYQRQKPRDVWELAVEEKSSGDLIGACNLTTVAPREGDLGYMLSRAVWGRGYATEIAQALVGSGLDDLKFERIIATVDPRNLASVRVLEKTGFQWEAAYRKDAHQHRRARDCHLYVLYRGMQP